MSKLLILEDDNNIKKLIEDIVKIAGHECDTVSDGMEAFNRILNEKYDLILMDIMVPNMDGFEIMNNISQMEIPVIFVTAMNNIESIVQGFSLRNKRLYKKTF